mmetsp:Transcript_38154/g.73351  ORF Transcript_38154/g.73351 Transcript_38154/m.73351 type:complete len:387 (-) Transcript_38154:94-1254(-)
MHAIFELVGAAMGTSGALIEKHLPSFVFVPEALSRPVYSLKRPSFCRVGLEDRESRGNDVSVNSIDVVAQPRSREVLTDAIESIQLELLSRPLFKNWANISVSQFVALEGVEIQVHQICANFVEVHLCGAVDVPLLVRASGDVLVVEVSELLVQFVRNLEQLGPGVRELGQGRSKEVVPHVRVCGDSVAALNPTTLAIVVAECHVKRGVRLRFDLLVGPGFPLALTVPDTPIGTLVREFLASDHLDAVSDGLGAPFGVSVALLRNIDQDRTGRAAIQPKPLREVLLRGELCVQSFVVHVHVVLPNHDTLAGWKMSFCRSPILHVVKSLLARLVLTSEEKHKTPRTQLVRCVHENIIEVLAIKKINHTAAHLRLRNTVRIGEKPACG